MLQSNRRHRIEERLAHAEVITQSTGTATLEDWAALDLNAPNSQVLRLTRVRRDDNGSPVVVEEVVLALERFRDLAANGSDIPDIVELAQRHGLSLGHATERIAIVPASRAMVSHLQLAPGANVLKFNRIVETADGEPVEWCVTFRKI